MFIELKLMLHAYLACEEREKNRDCAHFALSITPGSSQEVYHYPLQDSTISTKRHSSNNIN
jgi:hypothetical protein